MSNIPSFIDDLHNMRVDNRAGAVAVFTFQDDEGVPRNVESAPIFLTVGTFRKALSAGDTVYRKVLTIEDGELAAFLNKQNTYYAILDETNPQVPQMILKGKLIVVER